MTKTISLADDAYDALRAAKRPGESFSDVARRAARLLRQQVLFDRSVRVEMTDEEADDLKRRIYADRDASLEPRYTP